MTPRQPFGIAIVAALAALANPALVATVAADNIAGTFERCAVVTDFVAPVPGQAGSFTLLGIGPGLDNAVEDATHHRFPFADEVSLDPALVTELTNLAAGDHFTCLRIKADQTPNQHAAVTELVVLATERLCPQITIDQDGTVVMHVDNDEWSGQLLGEARRLIDADIYMASYLRVIEAVGAVPLGCLNFTMDGAGVLKTLAVDLKVTPCGWVEWSDKVGLTVGPVLVADRDSTSADLLPDQARAATMLLVGRHIDACVGIDVVANQWRKATISLWTRSCGDVARASSGLIEIDGLGIPALLLTARQAAELSASIGGHACLEISVNTNLYSAELTELYGPPPTTGPSATRPNPSPAPSAPATPSAAPVSPSASPTLTSSPPAVIPTGALGTDTGPSLPLLVVAIAIVLAGAGSVGAYLMYRRRRLGLAPAPGPRTETDGSAAAPMARPAGAPPPASVPPAISLTRREQEVIGMLLEGFSNKDIATRLFISESTAGVHVSNVMSKLGARSRAEAAAFAYRMGLGLPGRQH
jgi:DNA-binding CsgD family transcriptional regulator